MSYSFLEEIFGTGEYDVLYGVIGFFVILTLAICLIALIIKVVTRWIFFKKCGEEGWKALIPIYTDITIIKISGLNWWWLLLIYASAFMSGMQTSMNVMGSISNDTSLEAIGAFFGLFSLLASVASIFAKVNLCYNIAKRFNKDAGYAALIFFFEPIMLLILGLSKSNEYDETIEVSPNGLFGNTPAAAKKTSSKFCSECGNKVNSNEDYCGNCGKKMR